MNTTRIKILGSIILILLLITGCSSKDPKEVKREVVGEKESITVAKNFIQSVLDYNQDHDADLTLISDYTQFWEYVQKEGLAKELSQTILSADNYGDSEWETIQRFYDLQLKPLINYLYGYGMDDFVYVFDPLLGSIDVNIKPESMDKGIYLLNDQSESMFNIFVERVKGDGIKVVSVYTEQPLAIENKYMWLAKDKYPDYVAQVKSHAEAENQQQEEQKQEEAAQAVLDAQAQAEGEEEQKKLELEQKEQELQLEKQQEMEEKCSVEEQYSDALVTFTYDGCMTISGSLDSDKAMTITREEMEHELVGKSFSIEIKAQVNAEKLTFADLDKEKYDIEYDSLFGDYGFVQLYNKSESGDSTEVFEGIVANGGQRVTITLRYKGESKPLIVDNLFHTLLFQ